MRAEVSKVNIEPWLPLVGKPSRYIDHELNAVRKPWQTVNFCFAFPDVYEVGISHLGLKILYSIVNRIDGCLADRCYLPWLDLIEIMRREGLPLFGLESREPLREFDAVGITLQSELTFSNVLETLDLARIPVYSRDRGEADPIVIAGGPCAINPLPLAPFFDLFFLGEAEEGIKEIARVFLAIPGRAARIAALAEIPGCYVPAVHDALIPGGWKVKVRKYAGFSAGTDTHSPQILSWQLATHNRCVAEIMRGCSRGCRFCHAGYFYRPVRERGSDGVLCDILAEVKLSGWDEAGLLSLSSSDYSQIRPLLFSLLNSVDTDKTHVSLPSLRVDSLDDEVVQLMRALGREGLTIAPEAGSQRLRDVINKNLSEAQILAGVQTALDLGWQKLKLYFMIGLPHETEEDIDAIIALIETISRLGKKRLQINVTLSPFVPKAFTPFQWAPMLSRNLLLQRCQRIKRAFERQRQIKIKYHTIENSLLEAVFSRGDGGVAAALHRAWQLGAKFDGWNECFDWVLWQRAFAETGLDPEACVSARDPGQLLPWDFVDLGVCREFLEAEWSNAAQAKPTPDCREICSQCGICDEEVHTVDAPPSALPDLSGPQAKAAVAADRNVQFRYRVTYSKTGALRFISHLDWMRMLFRLIGKAELDTVFTQGFSPHPKVSLCPPLPLGVESVCEFFDISFYRRYEGSQIGAELTRGGIPDFAVTDCEPIGKGGAIPAAELLRVEVSPALADHVAGQLAAFAGETEHIFTKATDTRSKSYDLKQIILGWEWREGLLYLRKSLASPSLYDVLTELFALDKAELYRFRIVRTGWDF